MEMLQLKFSSISFLAFHQIQLVFFCMHINETTEMKTPLLIALFQFWHMLILEVPAIQTQCLS